MARIDVPISTDAVRLESRLVQEAISCLLDASMDLECHARSSAIPIPESLGSSRKGRVRDRCLSPES